MLILTLTDDFSVETRSETRVLAGEVWKSGGPALFSKIQFVYHFVDANLVYMKHTTLEDDEKVRMRIVDEYVSAPWNSART